MVGDGAENAHFIFHRIGSGADVSDHVAGTDAAVGRFEEDNLIAVAGVGRPLYEHAGFIVGIFPDTLDAVEKCRIAIFAGSPLVADAPG